MNPDETHLELKDAPDRDAARTGPDADQVPPDADATEADVSEADLDQDQDQEEQEKQPMTGGEQRPADGAAAGNGAEKNGAVKLKIPEDEEDQVQFTGLNKEELLRVAGTPGWVRTRWALLVVFWLGWLGMLGGAVLIILQAPRCRDLPPTRWWTHGPLYRVGNIQAFSETQNLKGLEQKVDRLSELKVKGLLVGPVHVAPPDDAMNLSFEEVSPDVGNLEQFKGLVQAAHKKGISVVLDLTPNYLGSSGPWFSNVTVTSVAERLKVRAFTRSHVQASNHAEMFQHVRNDMVLIGVTDRSSAEDVSALLSSTRVDLLLSRVLRADTTERAQSVQRLYSTHSQNNLLWSLEGGAEGHMASVGGAALVQLYQLLLLTLPGTAVFNYGDEIGLKDEMLWDSDEELNGTLQEERLQRRSCRSFFQTVSELRVKERSLLFGDFVLLFNSSSSLAYLRVWDQSQRYLAAFNWAEEEGEELRLSGVELPRWATVVVSTNSSALPANAHVELTALRLEAGHAALLKFPYA
uniref:Glycosyl hydrolase family 13 catalytic domain-containing protein n=1 Tax=Sphaeramia orbicularis TaxID=375764 RepID=A0A673B0W0_9TELE